MPERQADSPPPREHPSLFEGVASFAIIAALLYLGAGIFVPLVLAILLAFALTPLVTWLGRVLRLPDFVAVIVAVVLAFAALGGFAFLAGTQVVKLAQELPGYQRTVSDKLAGLQAQFDGLNWLDQINGTLADLGSRFAENGEDARPGAPIPVTISNEIGPLALLGSVLGSILAPVATGAISAVFLIFLLMGRADLQDRFIGLVGGGRYSRANIAIADASERVGRYLSIQFLVNLAYGTIFGIGLWLIGVPSAPLWGLLIVLFRYIPFVGALIIATVPFLLAFAVDPGWTMLLRTVGLFLVLDLTVANVVEPRLYGSSTGVSPIAILLSAMFWATLWGPVGLILATPMTVCLVVIGRHLPQLRFLETLLGSEPVLTPAERLYQRMLKGDSADAIDLTETYVEEHGRWPYMEEVMLPALRLATSELSDGPEVLPQRRQLVQSFEAVLDDAFEAESPERAEVLIIGGHTEIDESAGRILALQLAEKDCPARVLPPAAIRQEAIGRLDLEGVETVLLLFMGEDIRAQSRYVARRLRRLAPDIRIAVCALGEGTQETAETLHVDALHRGMDAAADALAAGMRRQDRLEREASGQPSPFAGAGRGDDALGQALDAVAERFGVPVAAINLVEDERHMQDEDASRLTLLVTERREPLVVHSDAPNPLVGDSLHLQTNGIDLYAGVPLILPDGRCVGALVLLAYEPRPFTPQDVAALGAAADDLVARFAQD